MRKTNPNKENNEKLRLKREGHYLVDVLREYGYSKDTVYKMLARELGIDEPHAHLGRMNTVRELTRAYLALVSLQKKIFPRTIVIRAKSKPVYKRGERSVKLRLIQQPKKEKSAHHIRKSNVLPRAEYEDTLREVAKANQMRLQGSVTHSWQEMEPSAGGVVRDLWRGILTWLRRN